MRFGEQHRDPRDHVLLLLYALALRDVGHHDDVTGGTPRDVVNERGRKAHVDRHAVLAQADGFDPGNRLPAQDPAAKRIVLAVSAWQVVRRGTASNFLLLPSEDLLG